MHEGGRWSVPGPQGAHSSPRDLHVGHAQPCPSWQPCVGLLLHPGTGPKHSAAALGPGCAEVPSSHPGPPNAPSPGKPAGCPRTAWRGHVYLVQQSRMSQTGGKSSDSLFLFCQQPPKSARLVSSQPRLESPIWRLATVETWGLWQATASSARLSAFLPGAGPAAVPAAHRVAGRLDAASPFQGKWDAASLSVLVFLFPLEGAARTSSWL